MKFIIYKDAIGEYRWRLKAGNNKVIADSGEGYMYKVNAQEAIQVIKRYSPSAQVVDET